MTTNGEWLFSMPIEQQLEWVNAEHQERALDGDTAALEAEYGKGGMVGGSFCDTPEQGEVVMPLESWRDYLDTESESEDSRERLEAEIDEWAAAMNLEGYQLDMIHGWLNRRAKIMERKMVEMNQRYFDCVEQEKKIAELQAKVDELTQVAESKRLSFADRIRFVNEIDELTAERDNWKEHSRTIEYRCKKAETDCEIYRKKFGKCLDYADAIHALMDDEGMA